MDDSTAFKSVKLFLFALQEQAPARPDEYLLIEPFSFAKAVLLERDQNEFARSFLVLTRIDGQWVQELQHGLSIVCQAGMIAHDCWDYDLIRILNLRSLREDALSDPRLEEARKLAKAYCEILTR